MSTDRKTSLLIPQQVPSFIRKDHPNFVAFLEAYYEWMELNGKAGDLIKNTLSNQDIDTTLDEYIDYFKKEFLNQIPEKLFIDPTDTTRKVDKRKLVKNIIQFYKARGTEKSYKFFFRILFGEEIDFYFPRVDMLRASDGKWFQNITLRVFADSGSPFNFANQRIRGSLTRTSAFVEHVQKISVGPLTIYELFLNRSSITGRFIANEVITAEGITGLDARTSHILTGFDIISAGEGYTAGDLITISQTGPGYGAKAKITNVGDLGEIKSISIIDFGAGYSSGISNSEIILPSSTTTAVLEANIGGQSLYPGYYLNDDGKLSNAKFLQDNNYYQQFSYVIKIGQSLDTYKNIILETLHPAGLKLFGEFVTRPLLDINLKIGARPRAASFIDISRHEGYSPYGLYGASVPADYRVQEYVLNLRRKLASDSLISIEPTLNQDSGPSFKLGPSLRSIDREKFNYLPTEGSQDQLNVVGVNAGHWALYADTPIAHFEDMIIGDFEDRPFDKTNLLPEAIITTSF